MDWERAVFPVCGYETLIDKNAAMRRIFVISVGCLVIIVLSFCLWFYDSDFESGNRVADSGKRGRTDTVNEHVRGGGSGDSRAFEGKKARRDDRTSATFRPVPRGHLPRAEFFLVDFSGQITNKAVDLLELDDEGRGKLQSAIEGVFADAVSEFRPTMSLEKSGEITTILIPALPDRGDRLLAQLQRAVAAVVGRKNTEMVLVALPIDDYFGGFGQFDVEIRIEPFEDNVRRESWDPIGNAVMIYRDPDSGAIIQRSNTNTNRAQLRFKGLFDVIE